MVRANAVSVPTCLAVLACIVLAGRAPAATLTAVWEGNDALWGTASEWDIDLVPNNGAPDPADTYDVVVGSGRATLDATSGNVTIEQLELQGSIDLGGFDLLLQDQLTWSGGTIDGPGNLTASTNASITGAASKFLTGGATLVTQGETTWDNGDVFLQGVGTTFRNEGTFVAAGDGNDVLDTTVAGSRFLNQGIFRKQGTADQTIVDTFFESPGDVEVNTGALFLRGGGQTSGDMTVA
ncbi:MAG: hypothetical protein QNK04_33370, partial [Myxococcota bacterium]|nr:hypothetical protein [Myxococcota bacterium]